MKEDPMITRSSRHHHRHERHAAARQDVAAALASALSGRPSTSHGRALEATPEQKDMRP
jgi:hypothetical protein